MKKHFNPKAISGVSAVLLASLSGSISASDDPFKITDLGNGYMVAETTSQAGDKANTKHSVKSVGNNKLGSGQCGEGQCGTSHANKPDPEYNNSNGEGSPKLGSGQCGEGQCGTDALND